MKQKRLFLLSGIAGSGKSTWAKKQITEHGGAWISRDAIRFATLQPGEDYFAREDKVFDLFLKAIQTEINDSEVTDIYVDATHLNRKARDNVLNKLYLNGLNEINCVFFDIPAEIAIERNEPRVGQAHVPPSVIRKMASTHKAPVSTEEYFDRVIFIDVNGNETEVKG